MSVSRNKVDQEARRFRHICWNGLAGQVGVERIAKVMVLSHRFLGFIMKPVINWAPIDHFAGLWIDDEGFRGAVYAQ